MLFRALRRKLTWMLKLCQDGGEQKIDQSNLQIQRQRFIGKASAFKILAVDAFSDYHGYNFSFDKYITFAIVLAITSKPVTS